MSDQPLDLKFLPDWLKETPGKNPYADFEGEREDRPRRDFGGGRPPRREKRFDRPPGARREDGGSRPGFEKRGDRGARPQGGRREGEHRGPRGNKHGGPRHHHGDRPPHREPRPEQPPLAVTIEFLPEPAIAAGLAHHIRATGRAHPLLMLARMFLEKPERHRVKITSTDPAHPLWQAGENGPIALDRRTIEEAAFRHLRDQFYLAEKIEREAPKGNFTTIARCRLTGDLLGPPNHHSYPFAVRRLYEERFSRRMSFAEFQREIENVSDPALIEKWKEQSRTTTIYKTKTEPPQTFANEHEAELHFRANFLQSAIRSGTEFVLDGEASRALPEARLRAAVRTAWEKERAFPAGLMQHVSRLLLEEKLAIFKHRKRMLFITAIRPQRPKLDEQTLSENVARILNAIAARPKITRADLAAALIDAALDEAEKEKQKSALASDLHWLLQAGRVIEFHDGTLDLPLPPKENTPGVAEKPGQKTEAAKEPPPEAGSEIQTQTTEPPQAPSETVPESSKQPEPETAAENPPAAQEPATPTT